jgi:hypothetical protein
LAGRQEAASGLTAVVTVTAVAAGRLVAVRSAVAEVTVASAAAEVTAGSVTGR